MKWNVFDTGFREYIVSCDEICNFLYLIILFLFLQGLE